MKFKVIFSCKEAIAMIGELDSASSPVAAKTEAMEDNLRTLFYI